MVVDYNLNSSMSVKVLKLLAMWPERWMFKKQISKPRREVVK
jgi:hypothetical protein